MKVLAKLFWLLLAALVPAYTLAATLQWEKGDSFRTAAVAVHPTGRVGFTLLSSGQTGVVFTNTQSLQKILANQNLMNGSGVALGDYDGDGLCDFYLCNANGTNALFKNLGNWKFTNVTTEAGVTCYGQNCSAAVFADLNGDGLLDLLVSSIGGPNACFLNLGQGKFTNVTTQSGIASRFGGMSMALGDIDGNGTLDLYIANYGATSLVRGGGALNVTYENGKPVVRGRYAQRIKIVGNRLFELGEPDSLYLNDGKGNFKQVSWTDGAFLDENGAPLKEAPQDEGLSVIFHDINGDGAPDIYVCNDFFSPDRCWINDGKGHFKALDPLAWRTTCYLSMGVDFADLNRDGYDDWFVVDMLSRHHKLGVTQQGEMPPQPRVPGDLNTQIQMRRNTLFQSRGDGTFAEVAFFAGIAGSEWSWCGPFIDVDLDGWEDILVVNGFPYNEDDLDAKAKIKALGAVRVEQSRRAVTNFPPLTVGNLAFRNNHNMTFTDTSKEWGFNSDEISNGIAFADLDNDGDLDVIVNCFLGPVLIYRNDTDATRVGVRLKGKSPNTQGIGARIRVLGGPVTQSQEVMSGGRYLSGDDPMRVFACGSVTNRLRIEVSWQNGTFSTVDNAIPNRIYEIDEVDAVTPKAKALPHAYEPLFRDVSDLLNHRHNESAFDDFLIQPSLPARLSQMGPGVSWCDVDGDGRDDVVITSARGDQPTILRNTADGTFQKINSFAFGKEETGAALGYRNEMDQFSLVVGLNNFEGRSGKNILDFHLKDNSQTGIVPEILPGNETIGPFAITELDRKLVLFVGGRFRPGRYPEPADSYIYRLENSKWAKDEALSHSLSAVGLVSGAVWTDLNQDGTAELVLACDWGKIRVFQYHRGKLLDQTEQWGLSHFIGCWQSVTAADLDGDGRMDLIAGNRGLNTFYHQSADHQVELFYGDINGQGSVEMIEAYYDAELKKTVPWRNMLVLSESLPWLAEKYRTHNDFAAASMEEILSGRMQRVTRIKTSTLANMIFLNRGGKFEAHELPDEAQYAPVFGISAADFDGDGNIDLFLAQNFFAVREDDSRMDAGRGLLLRGTGSDKFQPVSGQESGIKIYGEQRGCAVSDYDADGRVDLVVTQNGTQTKLFKNERAKPGVRVRIKGPPENRLGAGVQLRVGDGTKWGSTTEMHLGSGYWSQDSAVQVLAPITGDQKIESLWPGGKLSQRSIPANAREIQIDGEGTVTVLR